MTVRDELVELIRSLPEMPGHRWADACAHFVDDHGPALLAMVGAFESDRKSLVNLIADASVARLALAHCADKSPMYQEAYELLSGAIDAARGKSIDLAMAAK